MPKTLNEQRLAQILTKVKAEDDSVREEVSDLKSAFDAFNSFVIRNFDANDKYEIGDLVYHNSKVYAYLREKPSGTSFYADAVYEVNHLTELYRSCLALNYAKKVTVFTGKITPASTNNFRAIAPASDGSAGKLCMYMMIGAGTTFPVGYRIVSSSGGVVPFQGSPILKVNKMYVAPLVADYTTKMFGPYLNSTDTAESDGGNFTFIFAYDLDETPNGALINTLSTYATAEKLFGKKLFGVFNLLAGNSDARMVNPSVLKSQYGKTVKFLIECDDNTKTFRVLTGDNIGLTDNISETFAPNVIHTCKLNEGIINTVSPSFGPYMSTSSDENLYIKFSIWYDLPDDYEAKKTSLPAVSYPNVFDRNNSALIVNDKGVSETGDIIDRTGFSIIKIPVNGIDGNEYNVYLPNSGQTGFVAASVRFAMYKGDGTKIGVLVNNSTTPAVVNNAECRFLYITIGTSLITQNKVMVLKNTGGVTLSIWDVIPFGEHDITDLHWYGKSWASYGDSISAINNGNFLGKGWGKYLNYEYGFANSYGRSVGGQTFKWGNKGGATVFVKTADGAYYDRVSTPLDDYTGTVPEGCTAVRGTMCSWLRIKTMFPASIKNDINMVFIMAGSNDMYTAGEELSWVANDETDPEWAASEEYATYGGDYNIATTIGAVASTVMKFQAWLPNAVIILGTPLNGNVETNPPTIRPGLVPDEYYKGQYIKTVANIFGIPCIDVFGTCGINALNAPTYISDSVHPYTVDGCKMLARAVIGGLKTVYPMI